MSQFADFIAMGKDVGLEGRELREWAEIQFRTFKDDLKAEAALKHTQELEKRAQELEEAKFKRAQELEEANLKRAQELEEANLKHAQQLEEANLKHAQELELLRERQRLCDMEKDKVKGSIVKTHDAPRHRFPNFNEKTDDLDSFFQYFECQAQLINIPRHELKGYLLASLSGKAREIFNNIPVHNDYDTVKKYYLTNLILHLNSIGKNYFRHVPQMRKTQPVIYTDYQCILIDGSLCLTHPRIMIILEV